MFRTPSALPASNRDAITRALNASLADGLDLYGAVKVAHWNVKGSLFFMLHEAFEKLAGALDGQNDELAERAVTLGDRAIGTAKEVAKQSRLPELPAGVAKDLELAAAIADRLDQHLEGLREARQVADDQGDDDTSDLLTGIITACEKQGWFLRSTLA